MGVLLKALGLLAGTASALDYAEPFRPQYHFSPSKNWMNDPSGLLYHDGIYHLFFQYNPASFVWGNMSWGHATSKDLTHWEERPVALLARGYPEEVTEMYFTGSAVADVNNTSGFGVDGKTPLVAMYTSMYPMEQDLPSGKHVRTEQQSQSIAYSLDEGETWTTYDAENPVIHNPPSGYEDEFQNFRDPFVFWHHETEKWIAVTALASVHKLVIWSSENLKEWSFVSEFGPYNAVGGVWECPNLFQLPIKGEPSNKKWVLVLGLNPGGPPGTVGSGTQYFIGDFDGTTFKADSDSVYPGNATSNWMDWGPDFYAAASYNGLPEGDVVQIAWMNNWQYGNVIPTDPWRSAMSVPRQLSLKRIDGKITLIQQPQEGWKSVSSHNSSKQSWKSVPEGSTTIDSPGKAFKIDLSFADHDSDDSHASTFAISVRATSDFQQETLVGYNFTSKEVFVDRQHSGNVSFDKTFATLYHTPLKASADRRVNLQVFIDWSSVEVLGGQGEVSLTAQIFPSEDATEARVVSVDGVTKDVKLQIHKMDSAWH
ncbi:Glycoside hydrolase [Penicillium brevicompactum]